MLQLKNVQKRYQMGDNVVEALKDITLTIEDGDFVAIMGPSGSGKSTLMHVLGLLDVPTEGSYTVDGAEVSKLPEDALAVLRREAIGFIFQQFNLLPRMTALENVALPLLYSERKVSLEKAKPLLAMVGLESRENHRPNELSGGQQQRVAIARSLVNQPRVILADEPTGNLDSTSEKEIMVTLKRLNDSGITVVVVTHEEEIGSQARRIIRMRDGVIQSDERKDKELPRKKKTGKADERKPSLAMRLATLNQYFQQGAKTLAANKVRTGLSMLGILIGVAAVVAMLALGQGAKKAIETQLASLGSNLLVLRNGAQRTAGGAVLDVGSVTRLTIEDSAAIKDQIPQVNEAAPSVNGHGQITYLNKNWSTSVIGAVPSYATMRASVPEIGRFFTEEENKKRSRVAVIGKTIVREVFEGAEPIGEVIKINKISFQVIGILPEKGANSFRDQDDVVVIPVLTAMHRLLGKTYVDSIDVEAASADDTEAIQNATLDLMYMRHRVPPSQRQDAFQIRNMADIQSALSQSTKIMTLLLAVIAAISLLVGGIGIMNIMLVSVTERTREIGLRKAVGAKPWDILSQFLAESIVVSAVGGGLGILLAWGITFLLSSIAGWATSITLPSVLLAFIFSAGVGIVFGIYPARKASMLNPIDALRYE